MSIFPVHDFFTSPQKKAKLEKEEDKKEANDKVVDLDDKGRKKVRIVDLFAAVDGRPATVVALGPDDTLFWQWRHC